MKRAIFIFYSIFLFVPPALTQSNSSGIEGKQMTQSVLIVNGINNGDLSAREVRKLRAEQKKIRRMERIAKADGVVTSRERRVLRKAKRQAARHIARERNDRNPF